jgi:hypothetical protein
MRSVLAIAMTLALSAALAGSAHAVNVAGWDFSDFAADGVAGGVVDANYSSFDPTGNAGAESANFGTAALFDIVSRGGDVTPSVRTDVPLGEQQNANFGGPAAFIGDNSFGAFTTLQLEGQTNTNVMSISLPITSGVAIFEGDLTSLGGDAGYGWSISFAGQVVGAAAATVVVQFSPDCSSYSTVGSVDLDQEANAFTVALDQIASTRACALLFVPNGGDERVVIDNVSLDVQAVPEPAVGAQLLAGALGLVALFRRRA